MRPVITAVALSCIFANLGAAVSAQPQASPKLDLDAALASIAPTGAGCVGGVVLSGAPPVIVARASPTWSTPRP